MSTKQTIIFIIVITSALFIVQQVVYGQTANLMAGNVGIEYDGGGVFNISDVSIKYDEVWGPTMIGLIENKDPIRTIDGVYLSVQMYDKNNHLIGVMKGYPHSSYILPNQKTAFEIQSGDEDIKNLDHAFIEVLATDWGTSAYTYPNENASAVGNNTSNRPYLGIVGVALAPELSEQIGLNQTKGFLLTSITEGSPAEKADLRAGTTPKTFNGREINVGGDIILKIDDKEVSQIYDIMKYVSQKQIGDKVNLTIFRDNGTREVSVILGETPVQQPENANSNSPEELYDQCIEVAGKEFCDFLLKR